MNNIDTLSEIANKNFENALVILPEPTIKSRLLFRPGMYFNLHITTDTSNGVECYRIEDETYKEIIFVDKKMINFKIC